MDAKRQKISFSKAHIGMNYDGFFNTFSVGEEEVHSRPEADTGRR